MQVDHSSGLSASDIHVWRGDRAVLRGVSLRAVPGAIVHVQGPNGSGKTTLMRGLARRAHPELCEVPWYDGLLERITHTLGYDASKLVTSRTMIDFPLHATQIAITYEAQTSSV